MLILCAKEDPKVATTVPFINSHKSWEKHVIKICERCSCLASHRDEKSWHFQNLFSTIHAKIRYFIFTIFSFVLELHQLFGSSSKSQKSGTWSVHLCEMQKQGRVRPKCFKTYYLSVRLYLTHSGFIAYAITVEASV